MNQSNQSIRNQRRPKAAVSPLSTNSLHLRNPWVTAFWSMMFPGFGHIIIGSYIKGFLLIIWEFVINNESHLNEAIMLAYTGRFELSKQVLNQRWLLLYVSVFFYAIWDSYRTSVDTNKYSILADRENSPVIPFAISVLEINYFDRRNPWVAVVWSLFMPGLGHLYCHRLPAGFFVLTWWIVCAYFSRLLPAVHLTLLGQFGAAVRMLDAQWFLFMPSLLGFAVYDSYVHTVEYNRLFDVEQSRFLKDNYQNPSFRLKKPASN